MRSLLPLAVLILLGGTSPLAPTNDVMRVNLLEVVDQNGDVVATLNKDGLQIKKGDAKTSVAAGSVILLDESRRLTLVGGGYMKLDSADGGAGVEVFALRNEAQVRVSGTSGTAVVVSAEGASASMSVASTPDGTVTHGNFVTLQAKQDAALILSHTPTESRFVSHLTSAPASRPR